MDVLSFIFLMVHIYQIFADCSFNGQCVYNVEVNHCSNATGSASHLSHRSASGCACSDVSQVEGVIDELKSEIQQLTDQFTLVSSQLKTSQQQLNENNYTISSLYAKSKQIEDNLDAINNEIVSKQQNVESEKIKWTTEVRRLQTAIKNTENMTQICRTALSAAMSSQSHESENKGISRVNCNFEDGLCGYTQDTDEQMNWATVHSVSTTGPSYDHTLGSTVGTFMAVSGHSVSTSSSGTKVARITSPVYQPSSSYCLKFWYYMHGNDVRTLNVYAKVGNGLGNPIFSQIGKVDNNWHLEEIDIDPEFTANSFKIVFEASTDSRKVSEYHSGHYTYHYYNGDSVIAIDDVYISNTSCSNTRVQCTSGDPIWHDGQQISCYHFFYAPLSWREAGEACRNFSTNAHLVSINKAEEQQFLVNTIQANSTISSVGSNGFYTSGNDKLNEGHFQWTDNGFPYDITYNNWHPGQPNNVGSDQDCLLLQYGDTYEWGDVQCDSKHPYICEINA